MTTLDNQFESYDDRNENFNYLPQPLSLEDMDRGFKDFVESWDVSVMDSTGRMKKVPVIFLTQELWAEKKMNWQSMTDEDGEEMSRPYIVIIRNEVAQGTEPLKRSIPLRKKFRYVKVPTFDGTTKGFDYYKIPQPVRVDVNYEVRFVSSYFEDTNVFYTKLHEQYTHGQAYMNINGYQIRTLLNGDPSNDNQNIDIQNERILQVVSPIVMRGKLVDPSQFERIPAVKKIKLNVSTVHRFR